MQKKPHRVPCAFVSSPLVSFIAPTFLVLFLCCTLIGCQLPTRNHLNTIRKGEYELVVERIIDGDTIIGSVKGRRYRLRLSLVDAPEHNQKYGKESTQALKRIIGSKVLLTVEGVDKYGRILATAIDNRERNVAIELVRQGLAWCYPFTRVNSQYEKETCESTMKKAQKQRLGIWSTGSPTPPWRFRETLRAHK